MTKLNQILYLILICSFQVLNLTAQIKPANATVVLNPPHPIFLSEYSSIGSNSFQIFINFTDFAEPSWDVRLKLTIESEDVKIETKDIYIPIEPITVVPGVPTILQGDDLYEYLKVGNINLNGLSEATLNQSGKLPEGWYDFCVEVLDYNTGVALSNVSCNSAFLFLEPPPQLLSPVCEEVIIPSDPQNIFFQWQIAGGANPAISVNSLYKLFVYEVIDETADPYFAVQNNQALLVYESDFANQLSLAMDFNTTLLVPGKKYTYRVRVVDEDENDIYSNNGFSEWCWFYYGYPVGGDLQVTFPLDEHLFGVQDQLQFSWTASDVGTQGQQYDYKLIVKEIQDGQTPNDAMLNNLIWAEEIVPPTSSSNGASVLLTSNIGRDNKYVWKVEASSGGQLVAESTPRSFYAPPLVEDFYAGNTLIKVVSLENSSLDSLRGVARIPLSSDPQDYMDVPFQNLLLTEEFGETYLQQGQIIFPITDRDDLNLTPVLAENGGASFSYTQGKVTSTFFYIKGAIKWQLPHALNNGSVGEVTTEEGWLSLNSSYLLNGQLPLTTGNEFELANPMGMKIRLQNPSDMQISNGEYSLRLLGEVELTSDVRTNDGLPYKFNFSQHNQLFTISQSGLLLNNTTNYLQPVDNLNLGLFPKEVIVDLSEESSPGKLSGDVYWKGLYVPSFRTKLIKTNFDMSNQVAFSNNSTFEEDLSGDFKFWINGQGLQLDYQFTKENVTLNTFSSSINGDLEIVNNDIQNSALTGDIKIPFIEQGYDFGFEIPITVTGLSSVLLTEDLTTRSVVFNAFGGENRIELDILSAVFTGNDRLSMDLQVDIPSISVNNMLVSDFRAYGDGCIGIDKRNGSRNLNNQVAGSYDGRNLYVTEVGAALEAGDYAFSYKATLDLGDDVNGSSGSPILSVSSVVDAGEDVPSLLDTPTPDIAIDPESKGKMKLTSKSIQVNVDNALVSISGLLDLNQDHPKWGKAFIGELNGNLKVPTVIAGGYNMTLGKKNGIDFWYFDTYFNDTEGVGVNIFPDVNAVAMEGRVYRHMKLVGDDYVVNQNQNYGAGLFMQLIDQATGGLKFVADVGATVTATNNNYTLAMSGDISLLNSSNRTSAGGAVVQVVAEEAANEILNMVMPQTIDIAGGTLTIDAQDIYNGSLEYTKGDFNALLEAQLGGVPGATLALTKGVDSYQINGNAAGDFGVDINADGKVLGLGLTGGDAGYFNLNYDGLDLTTSMNKTNQTGDLTALYDGKELEMLLETNGGKLNFKYDENLAFKTGFNSAGSAFVGMEQASNIFNLSGDGTSGTALFDMEIDGIIMQTNVVVPSQSAQFSMQTSEFDIQASGVYQQSGAFALTEGQQLIDVAADIANQTGHIHLNSGDGKEMHGELNSNGEGYLELKDGSQEFGISGNQDGTSGSVHYKDNDAEFDVAADRNNSTGSLNLDYDNNQVSAILSSDSAYALLITPNIEMEAGMSSSSVGKVRLKEGSNEILLEGNAAINYGNIYITDGSDLLHAEANASDVTGLVDVQYGSTIINGELNTDNGKLNVNADGVVLNAEGDKDGNGFIELNTSDLNTKLALDRNDHSGEMLFTSQGESVHLKGNQNNNYALIDIDVSGTNFFAEVTDSIRIESGPIYLVGLPDGSGRAVYNDNGVLAKLSKSADSIELKLNADNRDIQLSHNLSTSLNTAFYQDADVAVNATHLTDQGTLNLVHSDFTLGLAGSTQADGSLAFSNSDLSIALAGNAVTKAGTLAVTKGDISFEADVDPQANFTEVDMEQGTAKYHLKFEPAEQEIDLTDGSVLLSGKQANAQFEVGLSVQGNGVTIVRSLSRNDLSYSGMADVIMDNSKVLLTHSGSTISFENGEAKVNGQVIQSNLSAPWSQQETLGSATATLSTDGSVRSISFVNGGDSIVISSANYTNGTIDVYENGQLIQGIKTGNDYEVTHNSYKIILGTSQFEISKGTDKYLKVSTSQLQAKYGDLELTGSPTFDFTFTDGVRFAGISPTGFSLGMGAHEVRLNSDLSLFMQYGVDQNMSISTQGFVIGYGAMNLGLLDGVAEFSQNNRLYSVSASSLKLFEGDMKVTLDPTKLNLSIATDKSIEFSTDELNATFGDKTIGISANKVLSYADLDRSFTISEPQGLTLNHEGKILSLKTTGIELSLDTDKSISISPSELELNYDGKLVRFGSDALYFSEGDNIIDLSGDRLELTKGAKSVFASATEFGLNIEPTKMITVSGSSLSFQYDDITTSFSANDALSFTDGVRTFELGTTGLSMIDGNNAISVLAVDGLQAIELMKGPERFFINTEGLEVDYDGKHFELNKDVQLLIDIDASRRIEMAIDIAKYIDGNIELIVGGTDNFLELTDQIRSIALTQNNSIKYLEGIYAAELFSDNHITLTDGIRTIGLFEPDYALTFNQGDYFFGLRDDTYGKPRIDLMKGSFGLFAEGIKNQDVTLGVTSPDIGDIGFTCDADQNLSASYLKNGRTITLLGGQQGISYTDSDFQSTEYTLDDSDSPGMDEPQHLGSNITDGADGPIKGAANFYYNSANQEFTANAQVVSNSLPCGTGTLAVFISPSDWKIDLGTSSNPITVKPFCNNAIVSDGFLQIRQDAVKVGFAKQWNAPSAKLRVMDDTDTGFELTASASMGFDTKLELGLDPIEFKSGSISINANANLSGKGCLLGVCESVTLASISMNGSLNASQTTNSLKVSGNLSGRINIADIINANRSFYFNTEF